MQYWSSIAAKQPKSSHDAKISKLNIQYNIENKTSESSQDEIPRHKEQEAHPADDFEMTNGKTYQYEDEPPIPEHNDYNGYKYPEYHPTEQEIKRCEYIHKYKEFMWKDAENYKNPPYPLGKIGSMAICNNSPHTILLSGGFIDGYGGNGKKDYSHVIQYNVRTKKYTKHSSMLKPNYGHKMFKIKKNIYIIGGKLKNNEIHIFQSGQKLHERQWISYKLNYDFGQIKKWDGKLIYFAKNNLIHVFNTTTLKHWTIDVMNEFNINRVEHKLPSKQYVEYIEAIFYYKNMWFVIGRRRRYGYKSWGIWYLEENTDSKRWIKKQAKLDIGDGWELCEFEHVLYNGYLIMGCIQNPQGYREGMTGIYDIENDIFVATRDVEVGLPLSAMILKKHYRRIYIFGGDGTDFCGKFLEHDQKVIILREIIKDEIKLIDGYIMQKCLKNQEGAIIIPKIIVDIIAKYFILSLI